MDKFKRTELEFRQAWIRVFGFVCCVLLTFSPVSSSPSSSPDGLNPNSQGNYSYPSESSSQGFVPSATIEDPVVFASRSHPPHPPPPPPHPPHPHHHHHHHHPHAEHPPGVVLLTDKAPKGLADSKALTIEKSPPELQFGLSFTVPFLSMSTERLLNTLSGKSFSDPYTDVASLLKLNVGGLVVAAVVGLAALFFVPSLLPGKLPGLFSGGFPHGFMPAFFDQLVPGLGLNKPFGYGQYEHPYDPYTGEYSNNYNHHRQEGENYDSRGRALKRGSGNGTLYSELVSTVQKVVHTYWGEMEACAAHAMCLKGKQLTEEKLKKEASARSRSLDNGSSRRHSRRPPDSGNETEEDSESISSFEHVVEAIHGMKGITKNMPIFQELHHAYKSGQTGGDCNKLFKKCPVTPDHISRALHNMGNYIFNN